MTALFVVLVVAMLSLMNKLPLFTWTSTLPVALMPLMPATVPTVRPAPNGLLVMTSLFTWVLLRLKLFTLAATVPMRLLSCVNVTSEALACKRRLLTSTGLDWLTVPVPATDTFKVSTLTGAPKATKPLLLLPEPPALRFKVEPVPASVMLLLTMMLVSALRVRLAEPVVVVRVMAPFTVMLPASMPVPVVLTSTLVPASSKALMAVLAICEPVAEGVHTPAVELLLLVVDVMVTSQGSNNQVPAWPAGALASPCTPVVFSW